MTRISFRAVWLSFAIAGGFQPASLALPTDIQTPSRIAAAGPTQSNRTSDAEMTPNARQLASMLKILDTIESLKARATSVSNNRNRDDLLEIILLRQKLGRAIQYAGLELEEALANIDGDLAITNMQFSYFSSKHDRAVLLNNVATFVSSGTLGVIDSGSGIKYGAPIPNIFGITGNSLAVGIPMLGLAPPRYKNPLKGERSGNMLAPIFGRQYSGAGYDPIIWEYLEAVPAESNSNLSRRQVLLNNWKRFRKLSANDPHSKGYIDLIVGVSAKDAKVSLDLLKNRSELLVELRAQVQGMYQDISDLNTSIMAIYE